MFIVCCVSRKMTFSSGTRFSKHTQVWVTSASWVGLTYMLWGIHMLSATTAWKWSCCKSHIQGCDKCAACESCGVGSCFWHASPQKQKTSEHTPAAAGLTNLTIWRICESVYCLCFVAPFHFFCSCVCCLHELSWGSGVITDKKVTKYDTV